MKKLQAIQEHKPTVGEESIDKHRLYNQRTGHTETMKQDNKETSWFENELKNIINPRNNGTEMKKSINMSTVNLIFNFKIRRIVVVRYYFYRKNHLPNNVEITRRYIILGYRNTVFYKSGFLQ